MSYEAVAASAPTTAHAASFWRDRNSSEWQERLEEYWAARAQAHRNVLVSQLHLMPKFSSIFEIGFCAGTNLQMIRDAFPWVTCSGIDINPYAVAFAGSKIANSSSGQLRCANILDDITSWTPRMVDIIFSCYSLAYVGPESIRNVLEAVAKSARVAAVFAEPLAPVPQTTLDEASASRGFVEWRHPYNVAMQYVTESVGRTASISTVRFQPVVDRCDAVVVVRFTS